MKYVIIFVVCFLLVYLLYLGTVIFNKKKLAKFSKSTQAMIFIKKYKITLDESNTKSFAHALALTNSFILALTLTMVELVNNFILKLLVAFLILLPLILILYGMIGKRFKKKEVK